MLEDEEEEIIRFLKLKDSDFPDYYVNKIHPEDYILRDEPCRDLIFHKKLHHSRLLLRICFLDKHTFIPLTFVCDTGAPSSFYLCNKALKLLKNRIKTDPDILVRYVKVDGKKMLVTEIPVNHCENYNVNIIGLNALMFFGIELHQDSFSFNNLPEYL